MTTVLITGGAGFIGCHLASALLARGYHVRVLDSLIEQVHARNDGALQLPAEVELIEGDIRDATKVRHALSGASRLVHLAAEVGVGQSMYAIDRYVSVNDYGTAVLFQQLIDKPVERVVVASSMSIYGEGLYRDADGRFIDNAARGEVGGGSWEPCDDTGRPLIPMPTPETKRPSLASVYALGKYVQERLTLMLCAAYGMQGTALRLFNVYGPGQALSNPYTGVLAIFASRLLNGRPPLVFEDGLQRRDFVHVSDVARAFVAAIEHPASAGEIYNIGSGAHRTIAEVGELLADAMGKPSIAPEITGKSRSGDIRHCFADISKAEAELGFRARRDFSEGLAELSEWVAQQQACDRAEEARRELEVRGLVA
jgi:dTDP-L-rhamnose 4-epimerase